MEEERVHKDVARAFCLCGSVLGFCGRCLVALVILLLLVCNIATTVMVIHPSNCDVKLALMHEESFCRNYGYRLAAAP